MRRFIFACAIFFISISTQAQVSFQHGGGVGYFFTSSIGGYGLVYAPRLNVAELSDDLSVSINAKPGLSFDFNANSRTGGSGTLGFDLPIFAAINLGMGAMPDSDANFGGYIGGGYSISSFAYADDISSDSSTGGGLMVIGGARFIFKDRPVGINASFTAGSGDKESVLGLRFLYYFGG